MESLTLEETPLPGAPGGSQMPLGPGIPPPQNQQLPPQMFTTAAQLLDLTDSKCLFSQSIRVAEAVHTRRENVCDVRMYDYCQSKPQLEWKRAYTSSHYKRTRLIFSRHQKSLWSHSAMEENSSVFYEVGINSVFTPQAQSLPSNHTKHNIQPT
jgi:hypothetical protein